MIATWAICLMLCSPRRAIGSAASTTVRRPGQLCSRSHPTSSSATKMPKLDGVNLALRLAGAASGIPVILMSAGFDDWAGVASVFLRKPFDIEDLVSIIAVIKEREEGCTTEPR